MSFSDEDLRRLKESFRRMTDDSTDCFKVGEIRALLARLEAAEACIDDHRGDCLADIGQKCTCGYSEKLEAWNKAKGK